MENSTSVKGSIDSAEAMQALEAGVKIIARMIVKAITAELKEQERYFGSAGIGYAESTPGVAAAVKQLGRTVYTVEEAGELLGISRATAYECVQTGQIPSLRFGHRIVVPRAALMKLLDEAGSFKSRPVPGH
jgi:excisionase family DNA binding protein